MLAFQQRSLRSQQYLRQDVKTKKSPKTILSVFFILPYINKSLICFYFSFSQGIKGKTSEKHWKKQLASWASQEQLNVPLGCGHLSVRVRVTVLAGVLSPAHKCLVADWSHCSRIPCAFVSVQPGWDHYLRRYATSFTSLSPAGCCNAADGFPPPLNVSTERLTASLSVPLSLALFASISLSLHLPPVPAVRNGQRPDHCRPAQRPLLPRFGRRISTKTRDGNTILIAASVFRSSGVSHARDNEDGLWITSSMLCVIHICPFV